MTFLKTGLTILLLLSFSGCASGLKRTSSVPQGAGSGRTVVLFLVDGLAVKPLQAAIQAHRVPNLQEYFLQGKADFALGQATFPTLTYSNTVSILTARPISSHPIISNQVVFPTGKVVNYERPEFHPLLRSIVDPVSVIGDLQRAGKDTASFSYVLGMNANNHMRVGIREGLEYQTQEFQELDERLLANFEDLLLERKSFRWPEFIYVHLIGLDAISHKYGPYSPQARAYLAWLDSRMGKTLRILGAGERAGQKVVTLLTSDHGFVTSSAHVPLAKRLRKADLDLVITNEARFLGLHLPPRRSVKDLEPVLRSLVNAPGVELVAWRDRSFLEILAKGGEFRFVIGPGACEGEAVTLAPVALGTSILPVGSVFQCPSEFDRGTGRYPFLVEGLSGYLTQPSAPDAVVLAKPDVSFSGGSQGNHGGLTSDESLVPVLLHNAGLRENKPIRTFELLKILRDLSPTL